MALAGDSVPIREKVLTLVGGMKCNGSDQAVSSVAGCIYQGTVCSNRGVCTTSTSSPQGSCLCESGYQGTYCETLTSSSSNLAPIVGTVVPVAVIVVLMGCMIILALVLAKRLSRRKRDDWEVDVSELDMGEQLGAGGFGEVRKATWKGTEVAVKMMLSDNISREMERNFRDEVRVMTALRHPNVVLFMAACTKPPTMCIVMELMALGSLYDVRECSLPLIE